MSSTTAWRNSTASSEPLNDALGTHGAGAAVLEGTEQSRARELAEGQQRLAEAEARLEELRTYAGEYQRAYRQRAESGTGITRLRDFQAFLARLEQATSQQESRWRRRASRWRPSAATGRARRDR